MQKSVRPQLLLAAVALLLLMQPSGLYAQTKGVRTKISLPTRTVAPPRPQVAMNVWRPPSIAIMREQASLQRAVIAGKRVLRSHGVSPARLESLGLTAGTTCAGQRPTRRTSVLAMTTSIECT
jgi:hypothetical protein